MTSNQKLISANIKNLPRIFSSFIDNRETHELKLVLNDESEIVDVPESDSESENSDDDIKNTEITEGETDMKEHLKHLNGNRLKYDDWCHVGWAINDGGYSFELYDEFSQRSDCYNREEAYKTFYNQCKKKKKYTVRTIYWMLKQDAP